MAGRQAGGQAGGQAGRWVDLQKCLVDQIAGVELGGPHRCDAFFTSGALDGEEHPARHTLGLLDQRVRRLLIACGGQRHLELPRGAQLLERVGKPGVLPLELHGLSL